MHIAAAVRATEFLKCIDGERLNIDQVLDIDTIRGSITSKVGITLSALVFALAELHNVSQSNSHSIAAASSSGVCSAVSCGQVMSKDVPSL